MAVIDGAGLKIAFDWESAEGVKAEELRATWARLEVRIGHDVVTQLEDPSSGSVRRAVYLPLYPLAEWVAYNWWFLRSDVRPGYLPAGRWSFRSREGLNRQSSNWLLHHNFRAIGEGFTWPDLTIIPGSRVTTVAWNADLGTDSRGRPRFLSTGVAELEDVTVRAALTSLVDAVLVRLDQFGISNTPLQEEWQGLRAMARDEVEFCEAAARLGLDPLAVPDSTADLIVTAGAQLESPLLDDFLGAADAAQLGEDLAWIAASSELVRSSSVRTDPVPVVANNTEASQRPWEVGQSDALAMRALLDLEPDRRVEPARWVAAERVTRVDRELSGLGGRSSADAAVLAIADSLSPEASRFAQARALWRFSVAGQSSDRFLVTTARLPTQQSERAFAAEFLAPTEGIRGRLSGDPDGPVELDELVAISNHFGVNQRVIEYQIINHIGRSVDDPLVGRSID